MRVGPVQRLAKAAAGIDQRRSVPAFAAEPLRRWARGTSYAASPATDAYDVVLWADSFTDGFASDSGRAAVARARGRRPAGRAWSPSRPAAG